MISKKKGNYTCKIQVECLECGKVLLSENESRHSRLIHGGKKVQFRIKNDAKQPRLDFCFSTNRVDCNANKTPSILNNLVVNVDGPDGSLVLGDRLSKESSSPVSEGSVDLPEISGTVNECDEVFSGQSTTDKSEVTSDRNIYNIAADDSRVTSAFENSLSADLEVRSVVEVNASSAADVNQVSQVPVLEVNLVDDIGSVETLEAISVSPRQPVLDKYNPTLYGDHIRDFQPIWYTKFPWIDYDIKSSKVSCFACHQFSNDNHFIFDNWKKIDRLKKHSVSQSHLFAMKKWADFQAAKKK